MPNYWGGSYGGKYVAGLPAISWANKTIWPIGDSITEGFNSGCGWRQILWAKLTALAIPGWSMVGTLSMGCVSATLNHEGHSGATIASTAANVASYYSTIGSPASNLIVILMIGTNQRDITAFEPLVGQLKALCPSSTEYIVIKCVPSLMWVTDGSLDPYCASIDGVLDTYKRQGMSIRMVNGYSPVSQGGAGLDPNVNFAADGIHPDGAGYTLLGNAVYDQTAVAS